MPEAIVFPRNTAEVSRIMKLAYREKVPVIPRGAGTGISGPLREPAASCVEFANASRARIIAADIPTPGMRADRICAFHRPKAEGSTVIDIGIPIEAECCVGPGELLLLPKQKTPEDNPSGVFLYLYYYSLYLIFVFKVFVVFVSVFMTQFCFEFIPEEDRFEPPSRCIFCPFTLA
jgi:hypothetical protein